MKQGTVSVLFGCHSVLHSLWVVIAWAKLYRSLPRPWQLFCILIHDIGHWGKDYLDDEAAKRKHWVTGARIAGWLFGRKGYEFVAGHDQRSGYPESALLKPDKIAFVVAPRWWLWMNLVFEPKMKRRPSMSRWKHLNEFQRRVRENIESGNFASHHDLFLAQQDWDTKEEE